MKQNRTYGEVITDLENGCIALRAGWNGKGMYIYKQIGSSINLEIVEKLQSMPELAKRKILDSNLKEVKFINQMNIINAKGEVNTWVASVSDTFADDWIIFDLNDYIDEQNQ